MSNQYPVSFSNRLLLIALGLVALIGSFFFVLPASALRYVGMYYAVVGVFNLLILPVFYLLRHPRLELASLETIELSVLAASGPRQH